AVVQYYTNDPHDERFEYKFDFPEPVDSACQAKTTNYRDVEVKIKRENGTVEDAVIPQPVARVFTYNISGQKKRRRESIP
ncbi:hypothetical protein HDU76_012214, partial [Blyttiomyces sp. JEL0837]